MHKVGSVPHKRCHLGAVTRRVPPLALWRGCGILCFPFRPSPLPTLAFLRGPGNILSSEKGRAAEGKGSTG